ncbi:hypothetical protein GCM10025857_27740 [Alicyclobacillus contaminans]|nr:hypothetical protein GCM10025857_27740 [Alicyclobacillus contaminans]
MESMDEYTDVLRLRHAAGGLGLQWTFLELPALVVFTIYLIRKNWVLLLQVVVPLLVIFVLEPADWWARYTLFMAALGAWALAYVVSMVPAPWLRTTLSSGVLAAICMSYGVGIVLFTSGEKRDSGFVGEAVRRALHTAPQHRTIGGVVFPEYRWVDSLTGPTHLMVDANVPALYAFYGKRVENTVDVLYAHTRTDLLSAVVESKPQYLVAAKGGEVDAWAEREPSLFQYVGQYGEYTVYRVTP